MSDKLRSVGEVTEWLKVLAWKVSVLLDRGTEGSNPSLSANFIIFVTFY